MVNVWRIIIKEILYLYDRLIIRGMTLGSDLTPHELLRYKIDYSYELFERMFKNCLFSHLICDGNMENYKNWMLRGKKGEIGNVFDSNCEYDDYDRYDDEIGNNDFWDHSCIKVNNNQTLHKKFINSQCYFCKYGCAGSNFIHIFKYRRYLPAYDAANDYFGSMGRADTHVYKIEKKLAQPFLDNISKILLKYSKKNLPNLIDDYFFSIDKKKFTCICKNILKKNICKI